MFNLWIPLVSLSAASCFISTLSRLYATGLYSNLYFANIFIFLVLLSITVTVWSQPSWIKLCAPIQKANSRPLQKITHWERMVQLGSKWCQNISFKFPYWVFPSLLNVFYISLILLKSLNSSLPTFIRWCLSVQEVEAIKWELSPFPPHIHSITCISILPAPWRKYPFSNQLPVPPQIVQTPSLLTFVWALLY